MRCGNGPAGRRGRIPLNDCAVEIPVSQDRVKSCEDFRREVGQALIGLHHLKIKVRLNAEEAKWLQGKFAMLPSRTDLQRQAGRTAQSQNERRELDSFGARAQDDQKSQDWPPAWCVSQGWQQQAKYSVNQDYQVRRSAR
jgi:hypothetical protein